MQKLTKYISDENLTLRKFAAQSGISASFISEITSADPAKRKSPSLDMAVRIQEATNGAVGVSDWPKLAAIWKAVHANTRVNASGEHQASDPKKVKEATQ